MSSLPNEAQDDAVVSPASGTHEEEQEHRYSIQDFTLGHEMAFNVVICMGQLMTQAGLAMTIVPLHIIGDHFQVTNPGQLSWLAAVSISMAFYHVIHRGAY